ncbi:hypothetical protein QE152_g11022 [Popillia japonica]|uniref:Uncharacterized protein n=1 Tax=Popillia japonica TaxID=7064 RepID=A0AAW1LSP8_POPJA
MSFFHVESRRFDNLLRPIPLSTRPCPVFDPVERQQARHSSSIYLVCVVRTYIVSFFPYSHGARPTTLGDLTGLTMSSMFSRIMGYRSLRAAGTGTGGIMGSIERSGLR